MKTRNHSRRKSYGKKAPTRNLTGRKQRALEKARIREVKAIENVTPPKTKTPWRGPRSKPDPGTHACQTLGFGGLGCSLLLLALPLLAAGFLDVLSVGLLILGFWFLGGAVYSFLNSRGGW